MFLELLELKAERARHDLMFAPPEAVPALQGEAIACSELRDDIANYKPLPKA